MWSTQLTHTSRLSTAAWLGMSLTEPAHHLQESLAFKPLPWRGNAWFNGPLMASKLPTGFLSFIEKKRSSKIRDEIAFSPWAEDFWQGVVARCPRGVGEAPSVLTWPRAFSAAFSNDLPLLLPTPHPSISGSRVLTWLQPSVKWCWTRRPNNV